MAHKLPLALCINLCTPLTSRAIVCSQSAWIDVDEEEKMRKMGNIQHLLN